MFHYSASNSFSHWSALYSIHCFITSYYFFVSHLAGYLKNDFQSKESEKVDLGPANKSLFLCGFRVLFLNILRCSKSIFFHLL